MSSPVMLLLAVASPVALAALLWFEGYVEKRLGEPQAAGRDVYDALADQGLTRTAPPAPRDG